MSSKFPIHPIVHDASVAPAVDTSPHSLGYESEPHDSDPSPSRRVKRLSSVVEKLGRSLSAKSPRPESPTSPGHHKRMFSLNRKGKGAAKNDLAAGLSSSAPSINATNSPTNSSMPQQRQSTDDSPFITPPSPTLTASRPPLNAFRGAGSMRAGTQTLIQALQAIPWAEDSGHEDENLSDGEEPEFDNQPKKSLASSIHTIYRPVARSMRVTASRKHSRATLPIQEPLTDEEPADEESSPSDEEAPDFEDEVATPLPTVSKSPQIPALERAIMSRSGSMATVRLQRRTKLATKLKEVFELDGIEEVRAEMPCWLLRSVLLQGYMYLTNTYLCFFAHMPAREDQVLKSGSLTKKTQRTKRWIKHWFVLKNDALSWYQSSSDPYFPHGIVDLRYAISCEAVGEKGFQVRTHQKTVSLLADSVPSREEWVKAIRKVIFKAQNMGDSVKIAIPYSAILDVEKSEAMDFSETIEVKVYDKEASDHFSVDSYFFAYFHNIEGALEQIRDAVRLQRIKPGTGREQVLDTTSSRPNISQPERPSSIPSSSSSVFRISALLKPFQESKSSSTVSCPQTTSEELEEFTHISRRPDSSSFVPVTTGSPSSTPGPSKNVSADQTPDVTPTQSQVQKGHTYPPGTVVSPPLPHRDSSMSTTTSTTSILPSTTSWLGVPGWLKSSRSKTLFGGSAPTSETNVADVNPPDGKVQEMYSSTESTQSNKWSGHGDLAYSILETPTIPVDDETVEKFRTAFAYDEKETLLGYFPGYIFRLLPVFGKLYISTNFFCFKSSGALNARTRMTLPIRDILSAEMSKATRFGHHGLIIIVKGHEELFFEFGAQDKRAAFVSLLERQMEDVKRRLASGVSVPTQGEKDALILEEFEPPSLSVEAAELIMPENMSDSVPAVMFTSASSTFLTFKPHKSLHFTFLTIGSRGDVQPYIALAKGLKADGHRVRIATHGEFKEWIESHDIEFGYVGGDPAELMRICVENGTFTVAFLKEGLLKFRGWLDDLLKTSWEACQGTDILIESPSAMGGYHIAEALSIPYFRAFTMTWTRTRAYPHAFAVPERKMGGGYNYMSYVMFDQVFWRAISGQINRWRKNTLNLGSTSLDKMEPHKIPFLYNFSPHVVPQPLDWPEWIRVTGYWFLDSADVSSKKWTPPPDLLEFIDNAREEGKKVVYIGFGSIVVSDPTSMTRCVIDAIVQSGVYAILSKGWSDRLHIKTSDAAESEEPLPKQIYPISSIPHDWLFQRIDAACHHGGAGTTGASLRAGIPTIIKPFFGDQFFWADRVEALGVGSGVRKLTAESLAHALITATADVKQIDRARLLGEQIRAEDGVATAIESIYRDLEYAKSLIKRNVSSETDDDDESIVDTEDDSPRGKASRSSSGSARGAPSEDWSVISDQDDRNEIKRPSSADRSKRASIAAAMLSVLPDSFPGSPRRRTLSTGSRH